jgi:DNA-binding transcriptional MerR regulator
MRKVLYSVLFSVLILNIVSISNLAALESPLEIPSLQKSTLLSAFAQSDDENEDMVDEDVEETDDEDVEETDDEDVEETDDEDVEETDDEDVEETDDEDVEETEIQVEIKNNRSKVEIDHNGDESKFIIDTTDEKEVLVIIGQKTGLTESEIRDIWELEVESEDNDDSAESEHDVKITQRKEEAAQDAQERITDLESQISELEQRIQDLLEKLQSGKYFGNIENKDETIKSFSMSFDGNAVSMQDESEAIISGELFLETQYTNKDISKMRVTGGEIIVGDTYYDVMFGKVRISSSGPSGAKDSMILIGEVVDQEGNMSTIRLSIDSQIPMDIDFGQKPIDIQIGMPSKIAKHWSLEATGQMELL